MTSANDAVQADPDESGTAHGQLKIARRIISMDEFVAMTGVEPQLEKEMKLPGDSRGATNSAFLFSINGYLDGKPLKGVLLAGECMLVQAQSRKMAERVCREALRDTKRLAREHHEETNRAVQPATPEETSAVNAGLSIEAGGGRARASEDPELLKSDPLMRGILATEIGKLPWKH